MSETQRPEYDEEEKQKFDEYYDFFFEAHTQDEATHKVPKIY